MYGYTGNIPTKEETCSLYICFTLKFTRLFCTDESYTLPTIFAADFEQIAHARQLESKLSLFSLTRDFLRQCKYKKNLANYAHCGLYFHIFYRNVWIWTVPPDEVKRIWGPR